MKKPKRKYVIEDRQGGEKGGMEGMTEGGKRGKVGSERKSEGLRKKQ